MQARWSPCSWSAAMQCLRLKTQSGQSRTAFDRQSSTKATFRTMSCLHCHDAAWPIWSCRTCVAPGSATARVEIVAASAALYTLRQTVNREPRLLCNRRQTSLRAKFFVAKLNQGRAFLQSNHVVVRGGFRWRGMLTLGLGLSWDSTGVFGSSVVSLVRLRLK
jgi:hypothetical protein